MMPPNHSLGKWGEEIARLFLEKCGYRCLDQRFRRPGGEIDLVLARDRMLVFVEVKTRRQPGPVPLADTVTRHQLIRLRRMARIWLAEHPETQWHSFRFDVVLVAYGGNDRGSAIQHLTGVG